jgi:transposase InsO family protein
MRDIAILLFHLLATTARLARPGGARSVIAESLLLKHQLLILNRSRERAPNLRPIDRAIAGMSAGFIRPARLLRSAILLKPSTLMSFHRSLVRRKYQWLFSPRRRQKPGPKGPSAELIAPIIEMKRRNPRFGCRRIAEQISLAFGIDINKDVVRRILAKHIQQNPSGGVSWLAFLGHSKDSLWSLDLFRCESLFLRSHWVMVVMDQCSRRIIGFAIHAGTLDGQGVCRMLSQAMSDAEQLPATLSTDHDPLFEFHRWKANLRVLNVTEIKSVPYVPMSHPFIERLIGTIRRELLDQIPFWHSRDLERKLAQFRNFYNEARTHHGLSGVTPASKANADRKKVTSLNNYGWKDYCRGLYQLPIAA